MANISDLSAEILRRLSREQFIALYKPSYGKLLNLTQLRCVLRGPFALSFSNNESKTALWERLQQICVSDDNVSPAQNAVLGDEEDLSSDEEALPVVGESSKEGQQPVVDGPGDKLEHPVADDLGQNVQVRLQQLSVDCAPCDFAVVTEKISELEELTKYLHVDLLGSAIRRGREWYADARKEAHSILNTMINTGRGAISLRHLTIMLCVQEPSVLLPAAVAVLNSHMRDKEAEERRILARDCIDPKLGLDGGGCNKEASRMLKKDPLPGFNEMLAQQRTSYCYFSSRNPGAEKTLEKLIQWLNITKLGGVYFRTM